MNNRISRFIFGLPDPLTLFMLLLVLLLGLMLMPKASAQTNLLNYANYNGTNGSAWQPYNNIFLPAQPFALQFGNITNDPLGYLGGSYTTNGITNAEIAYLDITTDTTSSNYVNIGQVVPNGTNGEYRSVSLGNITTNLWFRIRFKTTNSLPFGAWKTSQ